MALEDLGVKIGLGCAVLGQLVFLIEYLRLTKGKAIRNSLGATLILESFFVMGMATPFILASFFHLTPLADEVSVWIIIVFFFLTGVVMLWRTVVLERIERLARRRGPNGLE